MTTSLPEVGVLEELLSVCYQASLMSEEERPVSFRLMLADPGRFPPEKGPPDSLQSLEFGERLPFTEDEIRRLSPAAEFHRSLIGVECAENGELQIWGLLQSGPGWVKASQGGRGGHPPLPDCPVVHVPSPGTVEVYCGEEPVARLEGGELSDFRLDAFASKWLLESFSSIREELDELHARAREQARSRQESWAPLKPDLARLIGQHTTRRVISVMRAAHHGGTVLLVPPELTDELSEENPYVSLKYPFPPGDSRRRFRSLLVGVMNRLAEVHGRGDAPYYPRSVGWEEYSASTDPVIATLEEAIFEVAHLIAALSSVDGAVVMTKRFELLGFGAEISGGLTEVETVGRALDLEGEWMAWEPTRSVGTRHRSAYRLAGAIPGAVAIVISQDGGARFVFRKDGTVTYWEQA